MTARTYIPWEIIQTLVVPGRILHIISAMNSNLLRLKQIFVRYMSHEIRYKKLRIIILSSRS